MAKTHDDFCAFHGIQINVKKSAFQVLDPADKGKLKHTVNPDIKPPMMRSGRMTTWPSGHSLKY